MTTTHPYDAEDFAGPLGARCSGCAHAEAGMHGA